MQEVKELDVISVHGKLKKKKINPGTEKQETHRGWDMQNKTEIIL